MQAEVVTDGVLSSSEEPAPMQADGPATGDGTALLSISGLEKSYGSRPALLGVSATLGIPRKVKPGRYAVRLSLVDSYGRKLTLSRAVRVPA